MARRTQAHMWFRVPNQIYFNMNAVENLRNFASRSTLIITNPGAGAAGPRRHRSPRDSAGDAGAGHDHSRRRARPQDHRAGCGSAELLQGGPDHRAGRRLGDRRSEDHEAEVRIAGSRPGRAGCAVPRYPQARGAVSDGEDQPCAADRYLHHQRHRQRSDTLRGDDRQGARRQGHARRLFADARRRDRRSAVRDVDAARPHRRYRHRLPDARAGSRGLDLRVALHRLQRHAGDPAGRSSICPRSTTIRTTKKRAA